MGARGQAGPGLRVEHERSGFRAFLQTLPRGSRIAVETTTNWYWIVDEMEEAGHRPLLTHAGKAKLMMGRINKTDKLDAQGLATLLHNDTLPDVWIPPKEIRDLRELPRTRMALKQTEVKLKNRIHAAFAKHGLRIESAADIFSRRAADELQERLNELPPETRHTTERMLHLRAEIETEIKALERRIKALIAETPEMKLVMTMPGVGPILATVTALEIGDIDRFPCAAHLASYSGTVPRVISSGGRTYLGQVRTDVNRYLKWAFVEAANQILINRKHMTGRHVLRLYDRVRQKKGYPKAAVAVARHLAEATYWILKKRENYREPALPVSSTPGSARVRHGAFSPTP